MGRHYTSAEYLEHVASCARRSPRVNITTDVIVGFPTEDEGAFKRTLDALDAAGISRVHAFPYSPRPGTVAAELGDRVPRRRRSAARRRCGAARKSARATTAPPSSGAASSVLIDKVADTQCSGYTADYTRCYLPAGAAGGASWSSAPCQELHADGIALCEVPVRPGAILSGSDRHRAAFAAI